MGANSLQHILLYCWFIGQIVIDDIPFKLLLLISPCLQHLVDRQLLYGHVGVLFVFFQDGGLRYFSLAEPGQHG